MKTWASCVVGCLLGGLLLAGCGRELIDKDYAKKMKQERAPEADLVAPTEPEPIGPMRSWTPAKAGEKPLTGALMEVKENTVWIKLQNGHLTGIPLTKLSPEDQNYARAASR
jgi:hypothetical protein